MGKVGVVSKPGVSLWDTFWSKVYSNDTIRNAADGIIKTGKTVDTFNQKAVQTTKEVGASAVAGAKAALTIGPTLIVLFIAFYFLYPFIVARR